MLPFTHGAPPSDSTEEIKAMRVVVVNVYCGLQLLLCSERNRTWLA
jgi:hypothetical protein